MGFGDEKRRRKINWSDASFLRGLIHQGMIANDQEWTMIWTKSCGEQGLDSSNILSAPLSALQGFVEKNLFVDVNLVERVGSGFSSLCHDC